MLLVVPNSGLDCNTEAEMRAYAKLINCLVEIRKQLRLLGMRAGPTVGLEGVGVHHRGRVDLGTRVLVMPPCAADTAGLFENRECLDTRLLEQHGETDATEAGTDDHNLGRPTGPEQLSP